MKAREFIYHKFRESSSAEECEIEWIFRISNLIIQLKVSEYSKAVLIYQLNLSVSVGIDDLFGNSCS